MVLIKKDIILIRGALGLRITYKDVSYKIIQSEMLKLGQLITNDRKLGINLPYKLIYKGLEWTDTKITYVIKLPSAINDSVTRKIACILHTLGVTDLKMWISLTRHKTQRTASLYNHVYTENDLYACYVTEHEIPCKRVDYLFNTYKKYWNECEGTLIYKDKKYENIYTKFDVARISNIWDKVPFTDFKSKLVKENWIWFNNVAIMITGGFRYKKLLYNSKSTTHD